MIKIKTHVHIASRKTCKEAINNYLPCEILALVYPWKERKDKHIQNIWYIHNIQTSSTEKNTQMRLDRWKYAHIVLWTSSM